MLLNISVTLVEEALSGQPLETKMWGGDHYSKSPPGWFVNYPNRPSTLSGKRKKLNQKTSPLGAIKFLDGHHFGESPFCNLVLPIFTFLHWVNIFPGSFVFGVDGLVRFSKPGKFRQVLSFVHQALIVCHIFGLSSVDQLTMPPFMKLMYQIVTVAYVAYNITWFLNLNLNGEKIAGIFQMIRNLETEFMEIGIKLPRPFVKKMTSWGILSGFFMVSTGYTFIRRIHIETLFPDPTNYVEEIASDLILELNTFLGLGLSYNASTNPVIINSLLTIPYIICTICLDISWSFGFLMTFLWGATFTMIFKSFFGVVSKTSSRNTLKDIRRFNRITFVIDAYNEVHTLSTMCNVLSGSLHFSVYLSAMFLSQDTGLKALMTIASLVIYWLQIFSAAEVFNSAQKMAQTLKNRYQDLTTWRGKHGACVETLQGVVIVFNEMIAGNVGFQGWGFFTISYSFVGSVLSLIATYSIVAMQMYGTPQGKP